METANWTRTGALEVLEVDGCEARAWSFLWPARMVVQPVTGALVWLRGSAKTDVGVGEVLAAPAYAAHVRFEAREGARFRVLFEGVTPSAAPCVGRVYSAEKVALDSMASDAESVFALATSRLEPASWRIPPFVSRAREHLRTRFAENADLEALATLVGSERSYLCRTFQRMTGFPPYRFRAQIRIAHARALLLRGLDCTDVAPAVGFCDQSHLSRAFKELMGATPRAYARALSAKSAALASAA